FGCDLFRRFPRFFTRRLQPLKMLTVHLRVELELGAQFRNQLWIGVENEVDIVSAIQFPGYIGKLSLIHLLYLLDFRAFLFKLGFEPLDDFFHRLVFPLGVKDEQRFVTIDHDSSTLLNVFIAATTPLSTAHLIASTERSIADFTSVRSSSKK